ncbi:acyl-CoA dehydrogenase family protein [Peribacillus frigoritolerans]|uniref:acyl-CoA dehydrogenase family protein n=1 Tax=Peribacillus frigoritolerans TaxID=450367 RepID=UPI002EA4E11E|nr:acyl-CoA dehydrogenase family protein [Peribacillus frigoritolerans]
MDFGFTEEQNKFRNQVRDLLKSPQIQELLIEIKSKDIDYDARDIYRILGRKGLLAPNWPKEYGGLGKSMIDVGVLTEELSYNGIPEALYVLSVLIVGNLLMLSATEEQKERYLPELSSGQKYACILYSEPKIGSDLSSLETRATLCEDGTYLLYGRKVYSMKTHLTDYGLCAARTSSKASKYDGLTLFMVPLQGEGVYIKPIPSLSDESLFEVILDGVRVTDNDLIGNKNDAWSIMNRALSVERTGLDYFVRARRWFDLIWEREFDDNGITNESALIELTRLSCKLDASRLFTYQVLGEIENTGAVDESLAAISKWYASELACEVVWKGQELKGIEACLSEKHGYSPLYGSLEAAYREAPGLILSAGTSEMMLQSISKFRLNIKGKI